MADTSRRLDFVEGATVAVALALVLMAFLAIAIARITTGVASADDAYHALVAKSLVDGRGYGVPISSNEFAPFSPGIATLPAAILPAALLIKLVGVQDWVPGLSQLIMFLALIAVAAFLLARALGRARTLAYIATVLLVLMLISTHNWHFGALLGEPIAYGFLLIGVTTLAFYPGRAGILAGGVALSLALVTKQVTIFPIFGIFVAWCTLRARSGGRLSSLVGLALALGLSIVSLPIMFELFKLAQLGLDGYLALLRDTVSFTTGHPGQSASIELPARWAMFIEVLLTQYIPPVFGAALAVGSAAYLAHSYTLERKVRPVLRLAVLLWSGAVLHLAYVLFISALWPRYFWIGVALAVAATALPLLLFSRGMRLATLITVGVLVVSLGMDSRLIGLFNYFEQSPQGAERAEVVRLLSDRSETPYIARSWQSIYDIVYLMPDEGTWAVVPDANRFRGSEVVAIINHAFTPDDDFLQSVKGACVELTAPATKVSAYDCADDFWATWLP